MTTPLQVTILILIINSGGTPPRQREALFNEYLEVIYKREKAKGLGIVKTEKELLIGLHKFVGYLLQEEATNARTSSATLSRPVYDKVVMDYLRNHDPYSPDEDIKTEWHAITVDAGERLVLLVESPVNIFGFELRSIQEFFAACYLSDTAADTEQRYKRLAQIAYLPYWRNVTLFFAGRAGRNYPGEAANIVEVCKEMDRTGPDVFVKRGAEVALELAAERALGPNRVLQRSLLEHGLSLFDSPISESARRSSIELVRRLPFEDIRDHVIPIMEQRLPNLGYVAICNACYLLGAVASKSDVLEFHLLRLAREAGRDFKDDIISIITRREFSSTLRIQVIRTLLDAHVPPEDIGQRLVYTQWPALCSVAEDLIKTGINASLLQVFTSAVAVHAIYVGRGVEDSPVELIGNSPLAMLLKTAKTVANLTAVRSYNAPVQRSAVRTEPIRERLAAELLNDVKTGQIEGLSVSNDTDWLPWLAHLVLGDVTSGSWECFMNWFSERSLDERIQSTWSYIAHNISPIASVVSSSWESADLNDLTASAIAFGGKSGVGRWLNSLRIVDQQLRSFSEVERYKLYHYGLGILKTEERTVVEALLDTTLNLLLQPVAFEWLDEPRYAPRLSDKEFDRLSEWYQSLPGNSPWRTRSIAARVATGAISLGRIGTTSARVFVDMLDEYMIVNLIVDVAALNDNSDEDLKSLLLHPRLQGRAFDLGLHGVSVTNRKRRGVLQRLLKFTGGDNSSGIDQVACAIIMGICFFAGEEGPRAAIRSRELDVAQARLIASSNEHERGAGIALYVVRPPRSAAEWVKLSELLKNASAEDIENYWDWVLPSSAHLATNPPLWVHSVTSVLESGVERKFSIVLTDVLRMLLPRESQSLFSESMKLGLPVMDNRQRLAE